MILLNGTSSAGKTTLARAIQEEAGEPYLYWGVDSLFAAVPPKWGGGRDGPLSRDGFWYDRSDGVRIRYGPAGLRMLRAGYAAAAALTTAGDNVVFDEMLLSPDLAELWETAFAGLEVLLVGVHCPIGVLEERERARNGVIGLARGHLDTVHAHHRRYDVEIDTAEASADELAHVVTAALG